MKHILTLLLLICVPAWAMALPVPDNMTVIVMQANDGKVIYSERENLPMTPASTTKLLTSLVALQTLGADYRFKTEIYQAGDDLYIRFSGDPSLTTADLNLLLTEALRLFPGKEIKGNVLIDATAFEEPWVARGWSVDDTPWYFATPVHAAIIDENTFSVNLIPPKQVGELVLFKTNHPTLTLNSRVKAVTPQTAETLCQLDVKFPAPWQVDLEGCWPQDNQPAMLMLANIYPIDTAARLIKRSLQTQGIAFPGQILTGVTPTSATMIAQHQSAPLSALIKPVLQDSNNLYTESLTKTLGGVAYGRPTFQAGSYFIETTLEKQLSLSADQIMLSDGSGLSTQNLISANALAKVLYAAYHDAKLQQAFIPALSTSGLNGTLKGRLTTLTTPFVGKTGGMSHVSTLAGFHDLQGENPMIYVIMLNHGTDKMGKLKQRVDTLLHELMKMKSTS